MASNADSIDITHTSLLYNNMPKQNRIEEVDFVKLNDELRDIKAVPVYGNLFKAIKELSAVPIDELEAVCKPLKLGQGDNNNVIAELTIKAIIKIIDTKPAKKTAAPKTNVQPFSPQTSYANPYRRSEYSKAAPAGNPYDNSTSRIPATKIDFGAPTSASNSPYNSKVNAREIDENDDNFD